MATSTSSASAEQLLEHADWLRALARALVGEGEAEDLAQDTYEAALANPPQTDRPLRPWLAGVMRNLLRFRARSAARRQRREQRAAELDSAITNPEELVARVQTQQVMAELVLGLDEPFRSTILLRYYEGLSAAEIARKLDIPAGTVRWRLSRGLDELRGRLDASFDGSRKRWLALLTPMGGLPKAEAAGGGALTLTTQGLIVMKTSTKIVTVIGVILALLGAAYVAGWLPGGKTRQANHTTPAKTGKTASFVTQSRPGLRFRATPGGGMSVTLAGADAPGKLRLEGQVIDDKERAVANAVVAIGTNPARQTTTEADGSFFFEGLSARHYELEARAGNLHADGSVRLSSGSDPVILRARGGGKLTVTVVSAVDDKPVAGARVELRSTLMWQAHTDAQGMAVLDGVGPGWRRLEVKAAGFATSAQMMTSANRRASQKVAVRLEPGAGVAGTVVDPNGKPVAGARVWASVASDPFPTIDPRIDAVISDGQGTWRMPALAAGTYHFLASHPEYAESSSAPTYLDGKHERQNVALRLIAGGVVAGKVVSKGTPVEGAEVRVVAKGALPWRYRNTATTAADGTFRIGGLPLRPVEVVALSEAASSEIAGVDLSATPQSNVTLDLTIADAIAGTVVDSRGDPVAGASLTITPKFTGALGERRVWSVRGRQRINSDKTGAFRFSGLPKGTYIVRAARPDALPNALWLHKGVEAAPGADKLRIEVPGDTTIGGRVQFEDGTTPGSFTVRLGQTSPTPFASKDGAFSIAAPAGTFELYVAGPSFITKSVTVEAKEGEQKDAGTIKVKKGRSVSGRVLDADGAPVANASVAAGRLLTGGGSKLNIRSEGIGVQETTTDDNGRFVISGFDERPFTVVAGVEGKGRSPSIHIPRGPSSVNVNLVLGPVGSLAGKVTMDGKPLAQTVIIASPRGVTLSNFFVVSAADGSFALDMLAPGQYIVQAMLGGGSNKPKDMHIRVASVAAGQRGTINLDLRTGPIEATITIKTDKGTPVPFALVGLALGKMDGMPNLEIARNTYPPGDRGAFYLRMSMGGAPVQISGLPADTYSACVIPIANPMMARSPAGTEQLPAKCVSQTLSADQPKATYEVIVPEDWTKPK